MKMKLFSYNLADTFIHRLSGLTKLICFLFLWEFLVRLVLAPRRHVWFLRHFAAQLVERGAATVYATARRPESVDLPGVRVLPLDVTDPEPIRSNDPLLALPQVTVLPHIGSAFMNGLHHAPGILLQAHHRVASLYAPAHP